MQTKWVKLHKYERWKAKKAYSDRVTTMYWRYSHQCHGDLNKMEGWE